MHRLANQIYMCWPGRVKVGLPHCAAMVLAFLLEHVAEEFSPLSVATAHY